MGRGKRRIDDRRSRALRRLLRRRPRKGKESRLCRPVSSCLSFMDSTLIQLLFRLSASSKARTTTFDAPSRKRKFSFAPCKRVFLLLLHQRLSSFYWLMRKLPPFHLSLLHHHANPCRHFSSFRCPSVRARLGARRFSGQVTSTKEGKQRRCI
jgi:hypothetical protein